MSSSNRRCRINNLVFSLWILLFTTLLNLIFPSFWSGYCPPPPDNSDGELLLKAHFFYGHGRHSSFNGSLSSKSGNGLLSSSTNGSSLSTSVGTPIDSCKREYDRVTADFTAGLSLETLDRSKTYLGNRHRVAKLIRKISERKRPVQAVVCGGSISIGHGVFPKTSIYSKQLEDWLNSYYPVQQQQSRQIKHKVSNLGAHGADMCAMAKRMNFQHFAALQPDLIVLEFSVNDYQGQDFKIGVDMKTDVFFQGFKRVAVCAEAVVLRLLTDVPDAAIVFLEFQSAMIGRKTAQLLHLGVAQHYQVPVLSYADAMVRPYLELVDLLAPHKYSVPIGMDIASVQSYPHGCGKCHPENLTEQFRDIGCLSLCKLIGARSCTDLTDHQPCYPPIFAHDPVHPSALGHTIAKDLIVDWIATTAQLLCQGRTFSKDVLPAQSGWLVSGPNYRNELRAETDFILVKDTIQMFGEKSPLLPSSRSSGFNWVKDGLMDRWGWVATNVSGGEEITFIFQTPRYECYEIYLAALRSYETVGAFTAHITDLSTNRTTITPTFDCLWAPRISVAVDFQLTSKVSQCTGKCKVKVVTRQQIPGRNGNKVKIMSLSVRRCAAETTISSN